MNSKESLEKLSYIPIYEEDEHNVITDIDSCCIYKGDLCEVYGSEVDTIEKDLDRLEELEKAFDTLSKDDEKAKKLLSLEIEKNRKLKHYEDLERELGIDLITLINIFNKGFYARIKGDDEYYLYPFDARDIELNIERKSLIVYEEWSEEEYGEYPFKKYGKTWALTKEELENEK